MTENIIAILKKFSIPDINGSFPVRFPFFRGIPLLFFVIIFLHSCAPKLETVEAPIEQPENFSFSGIEVIPDKWWISFDDPALNTVMDEALSGNLSLAANWQQYQAALAAVRVENSFLFPQVEASAGTSVRRPEFEFAENEDLEAGVSASYELDIWGRISSAVQAEEFRAKASFFDYQSVAMTLSAEISTTWYQLLTAKRQLELINEQIETNQNIVKLIRARFAGGQIRGVDILRQEQLLESTIDQRIFYETNVQLLQNQLSVLLGIPPQNEFDLPEGDLPEIPQLPETGLPLELIRRRPDVQQAFNLVLAADREMASAIRSRYPRITLAAAGIGTGSYNNLFQNWVYTLAGDLVAPLIYGGRIKAEVDRAEALKFQSLYQYGQVVLIAFREVEDALIREKKQEERLEVLERRLELAEKTNRQLRIEFLNGMSDYLDVLLSLDQEQQLQRELIEAYQEQLEIRISLYRALAGGFETEEVIGREPN